MSKKVDKPKFGFGQDFQENILQYTVTDKNGYRALKLYDDSYFDLLEHQIIAAALKGYFRKKKRIPQSKVVLREELRLMLMSKQFSDVITKEDKSRINKVLNIIYAEPVKDGDDIFANIVNFAQYVKLKDTIEKVNLTNFAQYQTFSNQIRKAITVGDEYKDDKGLFLIGGIRDRQISRKSNDNIVPTPFNQLNRLTNAGGYEKGSVIVIIGPEKEFKTGLLVNTARGYLRRRKRVLYIDLENGQLPIATRLEQSIMGKTKKEILSGEFDEQVLKQFRKYKRLGCECHIRRLPAYSSTADDIQNIINDDYREFGLVYDVIIVDYAALMAALSGNKDDTQRISDVYVDLKNLALRNKVDAVWTANHVVRAADKRFATKFLSSDTAKCIDIVRHVDAAIGYNRNEFDEKSGTARWEIIDQRDGIKGTVVFVVDYDKQRADEMNKGDLKDYWELAKTFVDDDIPAKRKKSKDLSDNEE